MKKIESLQNLKIKQLVKLKKNHERKKTGLFIIEGRKELERAYLAQVGIDYVLLCLELVGDIPEYLKDNEEKIYYVSQEVFNKISYKENPGGILAVAKRQDMEFKDLKLKKNALVVVLESVEKPGNLGAILRSADATRVDVIIVCDKRTDIYNPNVIRASIGTVFNVPLVVDNKKNVLSFLQKNKIFSFATTPRASQFYTEMDFTKAMALVVGTEHEGLSDFWLKNTDAQIKIPMLGEIDSLNASVSTAVVLYEIIRQRGLNVV